MTQRTIWGFEVETSPNGKYIWPYDLNREVVGRILDEDQHIGTIAAEIGAMNASFENGAWRLGESVEKRSSLRSQLSPNSRSQAIKFLQHLRGIRNPTRP
ncbi:hypothetical protein [Cognatishimia activa]|uniref:hypothetical protein n=1 Tax=Cognatishimia activa TaxID=1715691 RepID=UPI00222E5278|nr:hypothetical protein [Cognatishimia activa]UZD91042.1 hypothetical protein M0D42_00035 [Cognatishimia activa]